MNENHSRKSMSSSGDNKSWRPNCTMTKAAIVPITTGGTLKIGSEDFTWGVPLTAPDRTAATQRQDDVRSRHDTPQRLTAPPPETKTRPRSRDEPYLAARWCDRCRA